MRNTYTKDDVQFHSDGYREGRPAVNVKVYGWACGVPLPLELGSSYPVGRPDLLETHYTEPLFTHEWSEEHVDDETGSAFFWQACTDGFEMLQEDALEIFGRGVEVFAEGRSGGWAVVDGLPAIEEWDAIDLGKWRKFEKIAKSYAEDIPRVTVDLIYANCFLPWYSEELERYPLQSRTRGDLVAS